MLEKMRPLTQLNLFGEGHVIFEAGQEADAFYMLLKGKVILEVEASEVIMISLDAVKPGYSFGWSALLPGSRYCAYAICVDPCETMVVPGSRLLELLDKDNAIGYRFMQRAATILKSREERRTGQFLQVMSKHPDLQNLMGLS
jgi:CRP-like cAMP-binding protein